MSNKIFDYLELLYPFTENIQRRVYGRELAREMEMNQKTVQNRMNEMEREGILVSERRGRTKEFRLNRDNILSEKILVASEIKKFYGFLSSNFEVKEIVRDVLDITGGYVVAYGSFVKGDWGEESDLDILMIGSDGRKELEELKARYPREIHLMFMEKEEFVEGLETGESYLNEILRNHMICRGFEKITSWRFENE